MEDNRNVKKIDIERRSGKDRRSGKLDEKFKHAVAIGFFMDMRKGERRRSVAEKVSFN